MARWRGWRKRLAGDRLFVWDQLIGYNQDLVAEFASTNLLLTTAALTTNRIRLGAQVTPVPRHRPQQLAREIATLDRLSGGRMIFGVGLGNPIENEYARFGGPTDPKVLAGMLDEGLQAITLLWSGEPVTFRGRYVTVDDVLMLPPPVQHPRVPIWVGGEWPNRGPARRAARWDGTLLNAGNALGQPPDIAVIAVRCTRFSKRAERRLGATPQRST